MSDLRKKTVLWMFETPDGNRGRLVLKERLEEFRDNEHLLVLEEEREGEPERCPECGQITGRSRTFVQVGGIRIKEETEIPRGFR